MKKFVVSLVTLLALISAAKSEETTNSPWTPSVTLRSVAANKYSAFGSGGVLYNKPVVQSDIFIGFHNGFYIDIWNSTPMSGPYNQNFGTEQDLGLGWAGPLSTFGLKSGPLADVVIDAGTTYFDEPGLQTLGSKDILYSHLKVSKDLSWFTANFMYENYTVMRNTPYGGGSLYSVGASKSVLLLNGLLTASTSVSLVYDNGGFGCDDGLLLRGSAELDWAITKHLSLVLPQVNWYAPVTVRDNRVVDCVLFAGAIYRF